MPYSHHPIIRAEQHRWRAGIVAGMGACADLAAREHLRRETEAADLSACNSWLRDLANALRVEPFSLPRTGSGMIRITADCSDSLLRTHAAALALESVAIIEASPDPLAEVSAIARAAGIAPTFARALQHGGTWRRRVVCQVWWRRALRRACARKTDQALRSAALIARFRAPYCAAPTLDKWRERQAENAKLLSMLVAIPSTGGAPVSLQSLADASTSNPVNRRAELMTRVAGFERVAMTRGDVGLFLTITAPSRFHRYTGGGASNPNWQGETPVDAQLYLRSVWARARAKLARMGCSVYGFRVAEPHHDGCPHWHAFLFCRPGAVDEVEQVCRQYAMAESPGEPGAEKNRFNAKRCDPGKGTAAGYIAKYIAKNIDGTGVDVDTETGQKSSQSASRVRAWASTWGIRQFQQIGGAGVSVWRELRRVSRQSVRPAESSEVEQIVQAADAGDWAEYTRLMGGPTARRRDRPISVARESFDRATGEVFTGRYTDPVPRVVGLAHALGLLVSRWIVWTIQAADQAIVTQARRIAAAVQPTGPPALAAGGLLL